MSGGDVPGHFAALRRNLIADGTMAVGTGLALGVVLGLFPGVARESGVDAAGLALLTATPFVTNVVAIAAGRLPLHTPRQVAAVRAVGCCAFVGLPFLPPIGVVLVAALFWLTVSSSVPMQLRMWGLIYPPRDRARLIGLVRTLQATAMSAVSLLGGFVADRLGGAQLVALVGAVSAVLVVGYARLHVSSADPPSLYSPAGSLRALWARPRLRRLAVAHSMTIAGLVACGPLLPLVQIDRLHLSLGSIGLLSAINATATTVSYVAWSRLSEGRGPVHVLLGGVVLGATAPAVYALADGFGPLCVAALAMGLSFSAFDVGVTILLSKEVSVADRPAILSAWNATTSLAGVAAPLLTGGAAQAGIAVSPLLLGCAACAAVGSVLYVLGGNLREPMPEMTP
jgi:MFS family permease